MPAGEADWVASPRPEATEALTATGYPERLAALLARRGVLDEASASAFLSPSADHLHDPSLLAGLPEAVERLARAATDGEKVAIVGDYDVDGVSATALLLAVLRHCGVQAEAILPHRLREGYGFQPVHVERAQAAGCQLIVTVDCGITSGEAVDAATEAGLDVIITDHHLPSEGLPAAAVLVNPRQAGCEYPFPDLAGVGLALKLALGLGKHLGRDLPLEPLLRIACLGTIADLVPLHGENRVIAALGLRALPATPSAGLKALFSRAGIRPPFRASDVGFRIGPRLNAAGRLASPDGALELLLSRDPRRAGELAEELEGQNRERQGEEKRAVDEARQQILARAEAEGGLPRLLVAWSPDWHRGVVGIAAGRLARELTRPTVLLAVDGEEAVGSGRSLPGIDLHAFLRRWEEKLERFGGHAQAMGMTVATERLAALRSDWEREAGAAWPEELLRRRYEYELALPPAEVNADLLGELTRLEPHGQGNPQPLLRVGPLRLDGAPRHFGKGHLSACAVGEEGEQVQLLGWRWQERRESLQERFEVLGYLEHDAYRGGPVLRLIDCRPC